MQTNQNPEICDVLKALDSAKKLVKRTDKILGSVKKLVFLNAVVPSDSGITIVIPAEMNDVVELTKAARQKIPIESYIGHPSTAAVLSALTGVAVAVNRAAYTPEPGDLAIVARLGNRPASEVVDLKPSDLKYYVVWYI